MEVTYDFEELTLPEFGEGALFYGQAILTGAGDDFCVKSITLSNGNKLDRPPNDGGGTLSALLFKAIDAVLCDDKVPPFGTTSHGYMAATEWADAVEERRAA